MEEPVGGIRQLFQFFKGRSTLHFAGKLVYCFQHEKNAAAEGKSGGRPAQSYLYCVCPAGLSGGDEPECLPAAGFTGALRWGGREIP